APSRHHHGPHVVVRVGTPEGVDELLVHPDGERVEAVGPVEGDRQHPVGHVVGNLLILHTGSLASTVAVCASWPRRSCCSSPPWSRPALRMPIRSPQYKRF